MSESPGRDAFAGSSAHPEMDEAYLVTRYERPKGLTFILTESGDRKSEVLVGGDDCDFGTYCWGFLRAANVVVDHVVRSRLQGRWSDYSTFWECPAYAALFLYRHCLELRLKELIVAYGGCLPDREHSLMNLWTGLKHVAGKGVTDVPGESRQDLEMAEQIIVRFDQIDVNSQVFRYPINRDKKPALRQMFIDMVEVKLALGWLSQFLEGWSVGVYETRHVSR